MKKILSLAMCLFVFLSCEKSIQTTVNTQIDNVQNESDILNIKTRSTTLSQDQIFDINTYPFSIEEDSLFIESLGWRIFNIVCDSLVYIVNGDMLFSKEDLFLRRNKPQSRMFGRILHTSAQHMLLNVNAEIRFDDANINEIDIAAPFRSALAEWNSLNNCNLYFGVNGDCAYDTSDWYPVSIYIGGKTNSSYNTNIAKSLEYGIVIVPSLDEVCFPGSYMLVDVDHSAYKSLTDEQKKYAIMHALGHLIGLNDTSSNAGWVEGTSNGTEYTIMNTNYFMDEMMGCNGFSSSDIEDLNKMYPLLIDDYVVTFPSEPTLSDGLLMKGKSYDFQSTIKCLKNASVQYKYEVSGGKYTSSQINDSTVRIVFKEQAKYTVKASLKSTSAVLPTISSCQKTFSVVSSKPDYPSSVAIGDEFSIDWIYYDPSDKDDFKADIEIVGTETLFDGNGANIEIRNNKYIKIKDAGKYEITISAKNKQGAVLRQYRLFIDEFYRSGVNEVTQISDELGFEPPCFSLGNEICTDDMSLVNLQSTINNAFEIRFSGSCLMPHRYCVKKYRKYRRLSGYARRMDVRDLVDTTSYTTIIIEEGAPSSLTVDVPCLVVDSELIGMENNTLTKYLCYYAFVVPEDRIELVRIL